MFRLIAGAFVCCLIVACCLRACDCLDRPELLGKDIARVQEGMKK